MTRISLLALFLLGCFMPDTQAQDSLHHANQKRIDDLRSRLHQLANGGESTDSLILMLKAVIRQQQDSLRTFSRAARDYAAHVRRFSYSPACGCHRVYYDLGRHQANYAAYTELDSLAALLHANPTASLRLVGHADRLGSASYNQVLARKRAGNLKTYLINRYGLEPDRINTEGRGDVEHIDGITDPYLFHLDRRVEVFVKAPGDK